MERGQDAVPQKADFQQVFGLGGFAGRERPHIRSSLQPDTAVSHNVCNCSASQEESKRKLRGVSEVRGPRESRKPVGERKLLRRAWPSQDWKRTGKARRSQPCGACREEVSAPAVSPVHPEGRDGVSGGTPESQPDAAGTRSTPCSSSGLSLRPTSAPAEQNREKLQRLQLHI